MDPLARGKLVSLLHRHEGWVPHAYQDSLGFWTIGYGRLIDERKGGGITREEGEFLLSNDIDGKLADLDREIPWWRELDPVRQVALVNMAFNLGIGGLCKFQNMLGALQGHEWDKAAKEALRSRWARQVGVRAQEIARMLKTGEYPE